MASPPPVSLEQLLFLYVVLTDEPPPERAVFEAALARPLATFAGEPLYAAPFARAAALMASLIEERLSTPAFRALAPMAAAFWLEREGYRLDATPEELQRTTLAAAAGALDVDGIAGWLRERVVRLGG